MFILVFCIPLPYQRSAAAAALSYLEQSGLYIFTKVLKYLLKARDSRILNMSFPCVKCKNTNAKIQTALIKEPTFAIFLKSMGFEI